MLVRIIILFLAIAYHIFSNDFFSSLLILYVITIGFAAYHFVKLKNVLDLRVWFVPLFTIINSLAILSEEYLMGGINISDKYSPELIILTLYIFNFATLVTPLFIKNKGHKTIHYEYSLRKVIIMLIITYIYFIYDFLRLGGFSHVGNYGVNQYDYSIFNVLTNLFMLTWAIGLILVAQRLNGPKLWIWFVVNIIFIVLTKVMLGYRAFMMVALIIVLVRVFQLYKIQKVTLFFFGILIFIVHTSFGLFRSGDSVNIGNLLFQVGLEFSVVSQINYVVFNEFENFQFGFSFVTSFVNIMPGTRIVFGDLLFYPALYFNNEMVSKSEDMGFGFSFLSELYMNFGVLGAVILACIVTYVNSFLYSETGSFKSILVPLLIYLMVRVVRSDSVEFIKIISYACLILFYLKPQNINNVRH